MNQVRLKASRGESPLSDVSSSEHLSHASRSASPSSSKAEEQPSKYVKTNELRGLNDGDGEALKPLHSSPEVSDSDSEDLDPTSQEVKYISFGALAKAQSSFDPDENSHSDRPHKRKSDDIGASTKISKSSINEDRDVDSSKKNQQHANSKSSIPPTTRTTARTSNHAPQALSSKKPVSRSRTVINPQTTTTTNNPYLSATTANPFPQQARTAPSTITIGRSSKPRDPRFNALTAGNTSLNENTLRQRYSFLDEYRESELATLRSTLASLTNTTNNKKNNRSPSKNPPKPPKNPQRQANDTETAALLRTEIHRLESRLVSTRRNDLEREVRTSLKQEEKKKLASGRKSKVWHVGRKEMKEKVREEEMRRIVEGKAKGQGRNGENGGGGEKGGREGGDAGGDGKGKGEKARERIELKRRIRKEGREMKARLPRQRRRKE